MGSPNALKATIVADKCPRAQLREECPMEVGTSARSAKNINVSVGYPKRGRCFQATAKRVKTAAAAYVGTTYVMSAMLVLSLLPTIMYREKKNAAAKAQRCPVKA